MKHSQLSGENSHLRLLPTLDPKLIVCVTNLFIQSTPVKRNLHRGVCVSTHPIPAYVVSFLFCVRKISANRQAAAVPGSLFLLAIPLFR